MYSMIHQGATVMPTRRFGKPAMMYKEETLAESLSAVVVDEFSIPTAAAVSACFLLPYVLRLLGLAVISMTKVKEEERGGDGGGGGGVNSQV